MAGGRGRPPVFKKEEIQLRKAARAKIRRKKTIYLGPVHHRWSTVKPAVLSDAEWASRLLESYERSHDNMASTPLSPLPLDMQDILTELDIDRENDPDPEEPLPRDFLMDHTYQRPACSRQFNFEVHADGSVKSSSQEEFLLASSTNTPDAGRNAVAGDLRKFRIDVRQEREDPDFELSEAELDISLLDPDVDDSMFTSIDMSQEVFDIAEEDDSVEEVMTWRTEKESLEHISCEGDLDLNESCFLVYQSCLLELAQLIISPICQAQDCGKKVHVDVKKAGTGIYLHWKCDDKHLNHRWASQPVLPRGGMKGNIHMASAVVLSGNNFGKIALLAKFLNLAFLCSSSFHAYQAHYIVPGVNEYWLDLKMSRLSELKGREVIIAGDGRMDSPGYCAKYCTYSVLDVETKCLLDVVVIDKRETNFKSGSMEAAAFVRIIDGLTAAGVIVKEVVTDAHSQISCIMKKRYPGILHSYDIWHGAKNFAKKLTAAAASRDCSDLRPWVKDITNHFWFCVRESGGSHEAFLARWIGILHHVTNTHEWGLGHCEHDPMDTHDKPWPLKDGPAHRALREVVYSPYFLRTVPYYLRFRSTSDLESFQNYG